MSVSVLVPFRAGERWRERAWEWVRYRYSVEQPDWEIVTGTCSDGPFNRSEAILTAAARASGDVFVVADSDVWVDAEPAVAQCETWAVPHCMVHRLSPESTEQVYGGTHWRGLELSQDNAQDRHPYRARPCGACVVITREVLEEVPPDVRFRGWGGDDDAWSFALHCLIGKPWRGTEDLVHCWHPPQERLNRRTGSRASAQLLGRYRNARGQPDRMRTLVEEGRACQSRTSSTSPAPSSTSPSMATPTSSATRPASTPRR